MGVRALTAGSVKAVLSQYPDAEISILDYSREPSVYRLRMEDREISIPLVNMRFSKKLYLPNNIALLLLLAVLLKLVPFKSSRERLARKNRCLGHILDADVLAALSGGDSFSDIYGMARLIYVGLPQILVLLMGRPLVLLPQTIGPFQGRFARILARYITIRAERVYARDHQSSKALENLLGADLVADKSRFCYDVGFVVDALPPVHADLSTLPSSNRDGASQVGLNVSGLLSMGGYTQSNMFGLQSNYAELVKSIIRIFIREKNTVIFLVPHVFDGGQGSESDVVACENLYKELHPTYGDRLRIVRGSFDQSEIKHVIGQFDFFIGSRMHACIGALSQSVPAVCIAYSRKFAGVMETIGADSLVADARAMTEAEVLAVIEDSYDHRDTLHHQLSQKMQEVNATVLTLFRGLAEPLDEWRKISPKEQSSVVVPGTH